MCLDSMNCVVYIKRRKKASSKLKILISSIAKVHLSASDKKIG